MPAPDGASTPASRRAHEAARARYIETSAVAEEVVATLPVGDAAIEIHVAGPSVADRLLQAFCWLEPGCSATPDARLFAFDSTAGVARPASPWEREDFLVRDEVRGSGEDDVTVAFGLQSRLLSTFDARSHEGMWWTPEAGHLPSYEWTAPLRYQLHWLLGHLEMAFVHAAVIGRAGKGILLLGRGGTGKSTSTAACLAAGWDFVADDYCVLDFTSGPRAQSVYRYAKLSDVSLGFVPSLAESVVWRREQDGKNVLDVAATRPGQLKRSLDLVAIVLPEVSTTGATPVAVRGAAVARDLMASTLFQMASPSRSSLDVMQQVVHALPAYRVGMGPHADAIVGALDSVLDSVSP